MITDDTIKTMTDQEVKKTMELAFGRILRLGSRPAREGDVEEYERCRAILMAGDFRLRGTSLVDNTPNFARDRNKGSGN
jgi:hypothetical protein